MKRTIGRMALALALAAGTAGLALLPGCGCVTGATAYATDATGKDLRAAARIPRSIIDGIRSDFAIYRIAKEDK